MRPETIEKYISIYKNGLLEDIIPFWLRHSVDHEYGGFMFALDRDGTVIDTDKSVGLHGRFVWTLATLYNEVEQNPLWLELAEHGAKFLTDHCIDNDGRMFFLMDRQGNSLRKRRYVFSESFGLSVLRHFTKLAVTKNIESWLSACLISTGYMATRRGSSRRNLPNTEK